MIKQLFIFTFVYFNLAILNGQATRTYRAESNGGLCNETIILFQDGFFNYERGCEASSHFSFGKWYESKDSVKLVPADFKTYNFIQKVNSYQTDSEKITAKLFDMNGKNLADIIMIGQYVKGKGVYHLDLDSTRTTGTDMARHGDALVIMPLENIFNRRIEVPIDSSKNYYEITLNISREWIFNSNSDLINDGVIVFFKSKDGLQSYKHIYIDENGSPKKLIYRRL